jgi:anti-anti-sigma factor
MNSVPDFARFGSTLVVTIHDVQLRDTESVQQLKEAILAQLKEGSVQNVVVDAAAIEFVGSVGFLAFLAIRRQRTVDRIFLCNLHENVREVFALCRLLATANYLEAPFLEAKSVAEALKQLNG